jgi:hypothetical protein
VEERVSGVERVRGGDKEALRSTLKPINNMLDHRLANENVDPRGVLPVQILRGVVYREEGWASHL